MERRQCDTGYILSDPVVYNIIECPYGLIVHVFVVVIFRIGAFCLIYALIDDKKRTEVAAV